MIPVSVLPPTAVRAEAAHTLINGEGLIVYNLLTNALSIPINAMADSNAYGIILPFNPMTAINDNITQVNAMGGAYPIWLQLAAAASLAAMLIGVLASVVSPGPIVGAIFPIAVAGIWLTGRAAGGR